MGAVPHWHINASGDATCDTEESGSTVPLGIIVGLISSIGINMGQNIQALGQKTEAQRAKPCTSKVWITGLTIFVVGSIGNMVAMAFASASILVPLESSQFVTNVLFSKFYLKKFITPRQYTGTALAVLGTVFTCIFGPNDDRCFTMSQLKGFYDNPVWIVYCVLTFAASALGWMYYFRIRKAQKLFEEDPAVNRAPEGAKVWLPVLFAVSSALIGGAQMIVHSKTLAELFDLVGSGEYTIFGGDAPALLADWFFWLELVITAVCGIFWAVQMNRSLGLYDPLFIIPLLQSSYITFGSTASGIFYQEFRTLADKGIAGPASWFFYIAGLAMIVVGILLLAPTDNSRCTCSFNPFRSTATAIVSTYPSAHSPSARHVRSTSSRKAFGNVPKTMLRQAMGAPSGRSLWRTRQLPTGWTIRRRTGASEATPLSPTSPTRRSRRAPTRARQLPRSRSKPLR